MRMLSSAIITFLSLATVRGELEPDPCVKHSDFGKRIQCIGEMADQGIINQEIAILLTQHAIAAQPSQEQYYSFGFKTGHEPGLAIAKQNHAYFDSSYTIPTRVTNGLS